ncbi:MAG: NrdH-redoxin [Polyangiaceae bacterium]|nr:NrdH-redoxin [Polyangiaceae bacterium]
MTLRRLLMLCCLMAVLVPGACKDKTPAPGGDDPTGAKPTSNELPPLEVKDDTANLLLTWIDDKGDFHVAQKVADVPEASRTEVRVVSTTREEGTGKLVYVADLSKKQPDGAYPVKVIARTEWDEKGASRRKARLEALAPPPTGSAPAAPSGSGSAGPGPAPTAPKVAANKVVAIVYGAEWCKPCHDAAAYLKQRGVTVVEKDVDADDAAQAEMQKKLERVKMPGASIPVIDVMGQILVGFSPRALEKAVESARNAKTL